MTSKTKAILAYLKSGKRLNQLEAYELFHTIRLGGLIHSLRKQGYDIKTRMLTSKKGAKYAEYYIDQAG